MLREIVYDADREEPDCLKCDRAIVCDGKNCGPEFDWYGYSRTVIINEKGNETPKIFTEMDFN